MKCKFGFIAVAILFFILDECFSKCYHCGGNGEDENDQLLNVIDSHHESRHYEPTWKSLDTRPLPEWYDKAKVGIFVHWGVFSVPSFGTEWFWYNWKSAQSTKYINFMKENYPPDYSYQDFAHDFTAKFFDANAWAKLFKSSGAQYVVLTSKHHEGFTLWPSKRSFSWNSLDLGPKLDIVSELSKAVRETGIKFGLYHSLYEWFNPMYVDDKENLFKTQLFTESKILPDIKQIINDYQPSVLWSDGDWEAPYKYWNATELIAWLYNESPVRDDIVVNDRWGIGALCEHGDFYTCTDGYNPGVIQKHKWENCFKIDSKSWGYRRDAVLADILKIEDILTEIVKTVSCGGNALINVGPTKDGTIPPIFQERLLQMGDWLALNGEAIYGTSPWVNQNDTAEGENVWYTCKTPEYNAADPTGMPTDGSNVENVYAITLQWPEDEQLTIEDITPYMKSESVITLLGYDKSLKWQKTDDSRTTIFFPSMSKVIGKYAWVLKINF